MAGQQSAEGGRGEEGDGGPGIAHMPFVVMEDLLDKLKLLNYELEFVSELRMRPLNRHYFVIQVRNFLPIYLSSNTDFSLSMFIKHSFSDQSRGTVFPLHFSGGVAHQENWQKV